MPNLPKLRRADCGHGFLPVATKPSGVEHVRGDSLYLCANCRANLKRPQIETKDIRAEQQRIAGR